MQTKVNGLLSVLYILILCALIVISINYTSKKIVEAQRTIKLLNNEKQGLLTLIAASSIDEPLPPHNQDQNRDREILAGMLLTGENDVFTMATSLKALVVSNGINIQQFEIIDEKYQIEIVMAGDTSAILKCLEDIQNLPTAISYNALNIRRLNNSMLHVVTRISYAQ